ncbi:MAG: thermonuclease family protein [Planctomycetota bacterium]
MARSQTARAVIVLLLALSWGARAAWRGGYAQAPPVRPLTEELRAAEVVVLDGDTFRIDGEDVRLLGADTPEKAAPWFQGDQEPWGSRASAFSRRALDRAGRVTLRWRGQRDVYGRRLVHLFVDEEPLAALLVEAALAYPTAGRFGDEGFPEVAAEVARRARSPAFEAPWRWRRAHRVEVPR